MFKSGCLVGLLLIIFHAAFPQDTSISKYNIGDTNIIIQLRCFSPCDSLITYINLHENESTSVQAAENFLKENGGNLLQLKQIGNRNITFNLGKQVYSFDSNRMFTDVGRKASLEALSSYTNKAAMEIKPLADEVLKKYIDEKKLVIALHNNTDSAYSILSYTVIDQEGMNAEKIFINEAMDPDDFIFTTDTTLFNILQEKEINVVLQSKNPIDDGSLSVYAYYKNIPYINVEAQHGHIEEQTKMIFALKEVIQQFQ